MKDRVAILATQLYSDRGILLEQRVQGGKKNELIEASNCRGVGGLLKLDMPVGVAWFMRLSGCK